MRTPSPKEIEQFIEMLGQADAFKPLASEIVKTLKNFGPETKELLEAMALGIADINLAMIKKYGNAGIDQSSAIALVISSNQAIQHGINKSRG